MERSESLETLVDRGLWGEIEQERAHLGAQEVVRAGGAERRQPRVLGTGQKVEHLWAVVVVADLSGVGGGQAAEQWEQRRGPRVPVR